MFFDKRPSINQTRVKGIRDALLFALVRSFGARNDARRGIFNARRCNDSLKCTRRRSRCFISLTIVNAAHLRASHFVKCLLIAQISARENSADDKYHGRVHARAFNQPIIRYNHAKCHFIAVNGYVAMRSR